MANAFPLILQYYEHIECPKEQDLGQPQTPIVAADIEAGCNIN